MAATVLMILGIGLFSAITATMVSAFAGQDEVADDPVERLRRLETLLGSGLITEAEYVERRQAIVSVL